MRTERAAAAASMVRRGLSAAALVVAVLLPGGLLAQGSVQVVNADGPGAGLNDPTKAAPVGGNPGTTLGQQRTSALQEAARIWASRLPKTARVRVRANFVALGCGAEFVDLGSAGALEQFRNFRGAPRPDTWYPAALAGALAGTDLNPAEDDIVATFNAAIDDGSCQFPAKWYYGLDAQAPGDRIDFVTMALHEMAHGLGFQTLVDLSTGAKLAGRDDAFMLNLRDSTTGKTWPQMSNAERVASAVSKDQLVWAGPNGARESLGLAPSAVDSAGDLRMYAPAPLEAGSSVSHLSEAVGAADLMGPFYTEPTRESGASAAVLEDIGWLLVEAKPDTLSTWTIVSSAHAAGANSAFYTTDVTIANIGATDATFTLRFLGHDVDGRGGPQKTYALAAGRTVSYADVLGTVFGLSAGWGAISISSSSSALAVSAQTSTPVNGGGTFGQAVPAASGADLVTPASPKTIVGVREDATARTNLALSNATEAPIDVSVRLVAEDGTALGTWVAALKPLEMRQLARVVNVVGVSREVTNARLVLSTSTVGGAFAAYASVIDNHTNDPRTLLPR